MNACCIRKLFLIFELLIVAFGSGITNEMMKRLRDVISLAPWTKLDLRSIIHFLPFTHTLEKKLCILTENEVYDEAAVMTTEVLRSIGESLATNSMLTKLNLKGEYHSKKV